MKGKRVRRVVCTQGVKWRCRAFFPTIKHIHTAYLPKPRLVLRLQAGLLARFYFGRLPVVFNSGNGPKCGCYNLKLTAAGTAPDLHRCSLFIL